MIRKLALLAGILPLLGVAAGGCFSVEDPDRTGLPVDCDVSDPECVERIDAALPTTSAMMADRGLCTANDARMNAHAGACS